MSYVFANDEWRIKSAGADLPLSSFCEGRTRPFYLYDLDDAVARAVTFAQSGAGVHYAMKANSHPRLLRAFAAIGLGADVVSLGEMQKALACGIPAERIIFSGVAKDREDLEAALHHRILQINIESFEELQRLEEVCQTQQRTAEVALRLNPHIEAPTHKNIQTATPESKFGLDMRQLPEVLAWLKGKRVQLKALTVHIGSQIMDVDVFARTAREMGQLYLDVKSQGFALSRLDLGGGLGIDYRSEGTEDKDRLQVYLKTLLGSHGTDARILLEPGRFLVARMGVLLARAVYVKQGVDRKFLILNAGMNHLMRPALYQAYHRILPIKPREGRDTYTVVGPICESTDVFAENREMPRVESGDWVAFFEAGAYGAVMANTYNETPLPEQWTLMNGQLEVS